MKYKITTFTNGQTKIETTFRIENSDLTLTEKIIKTRIPRMEFMPTALINQNNKRF